MTFDQRLTEIQSGTDHLPRTTYKSRNRDAQANRQAAKWLEIANRIDWEAFEPHFRRWQQRYGLDWRERHQERLEATKRSLKTPACHCYASCEDDDSGAERRPDCRKRP